jgi:hypothetical protein
VTAGQTADSDTFQFDKAADDQLFVEEFKTLREEILRRIDHAHRLASLKLVGGAALFAFCLKDIRDQPLMEVLLLMVYPLFALFMTIEWSFNNMRIIQLADYLHNHVEQQHRDPDCRSGAKCHGWENYLAQSRTVLTRHGITGEMGCSGPVFCRHTVSSFVCGLGSLVI